MQKQRREQRLSDDSTSYAHFPPRSSERSVTSPASLSSGPLRMSGLSYAFTSTKLPNSSANGDAGKGFQIINYIQNDIAMNRRHSDVSILYFFLSASNKTLNVQC